MRQRNDLIFFPMLVTKTLNTQNFLGDRGKPFKFLTELSRAIAKTKLQKNTKGQVISQAPW